MSGEARTVSGWPRLMRVSTAAAYCDEASVQSFLQAVGAIWPRPVHVKGKGQRWLKDDLDLAIEQLMGSPQARTDLADVF